MWHKYSKISFLCSTVLELCAMNWYCHSCLLFTLLVTSILLFQKVTSELGKDKQCENCSAIVSDYENGLHVLSRRKRYLTFPEGSSLQLVFCVQTAAINLGQIVLFGSTAALAWNLPKGPEDFHMLKDGALRRGDMKKETYFLDEDGKVIAKRPYTRPNIVNPAFAKRSADEQNLTYKQRLKIKLDKLGMHERQLNRDYLKIEHMDEQSIEFHRASRIGLYEKIEKLLTALGRDGRQCVLRKLCEAAAASQRDQGTFLQELLRVVFTLPKGRQFAEEIHRAYDKAHNDGDCKNLYPGCIVTTDED